MSKRLDLGVMELDEGKPARFASLVAIDFDALDGCECAEGGLDLRAGQAHKWRKCRQLMISQSGESFTPRLPRPSRGCARRGWHMAAARWVGDGQRFLARSHPLPDARSEVAASWLSPTVRAIYLLALVRFGREAFEALGTPREVLDVTLHAPHSSRTRRRSRLVRGARY